MEQRDLPDRPLLTLTSNLSRILVTVTRVGGVPNSFLQRLCQILRFQIALKNPLRLPNVKITNAIFFYTNYCHLANCTNTKQCVLSPRSILPQSM
jgi:hypothetical protein